MGLSLSIPRPLKDSLTAIAKPLNRLPSRACSQAKRPLGGVHQLLASGGFTFAIERVCGVWSAVLRCIDKASFESTRFESTKAIGNAFERSTFVCTHLDSAFAPSFQNRHWCGTLASSGNMDMNILAPVVSLRDIGQFAAALKTLDTIRTNGDERRSADILRAELLERTGDYPQSRALTETLLRKVGLSGPERIPANWFLRDLSWNWGTSTKASHVYNALSAPLPNATILRAYVGQSCDSCSSFQIGPVQIPSLPYWPNSVRTSCSLGIRESWLLFTFIWRRPRPREDC